MTTCDKFDWKFYVTYYKDLRRSGISSENLAWQHWNQCGQKEGRMSQKPDTLIEPVVNIDDFDWSFYLSSNPDLLSCKIDNQDKALEHWLRWGIDEGRIYNKNITPT